MARAGISTRSGPASPSPHRSAGSGGDDSKSRAGGNPTSDGPGPAEDFGGYTALGELALDGSLTKVAGVLLADSEYRHELESNIEPFKGLLLGLFFVSVGIGLDLARLVVHPVLILGVAVGLCRDVGAGVGAGAALDPDGVTQRPKHGRAVSQADQVYEETGCRVKASGRKK